METRIVNPGGQARVACLLLGTIRPSVMACITVAENMCSKKRFKDIVEKYGGYISAFIGNGRIYIVFLVVYQPDVGKANKDSARSKHCNLSDRESPCNYDIHCVDAPNMQIIPTLNKYNPPNFYTKRLTDQTQLAQI